MVHAVKGKSVISENHYTAYLNALLKGNAAECAATIHRLMEQNIPPVDLYTHLFQRALYRVGRLWETNRISVAVEHLATALTEKMLAMVYPKILSAATIVDRKAVISCSVNEYHQIGARMVADIMEVNGWDTRFLGANTPISDLLAMIQETDPDVVGLSVSIYFNMTALHKMIAELRSAYPGVAIFIGGQAFRWGGGNIEKQFSNVYLFASLHELEKAVKSNYP